MTDAGATTDGDAVTPAVLVAGDAEPAAATGDTAAATGDTAAGSTASSTAAGARMRHWIVFFAITGGVILLDQLVKTWVVGNVQLGEVVDVLGEWLRIWHVQNTGALFGLFRDQAVLFAVLSIGVMALIVWYHGRAVAGSGWLATVALGLLLGGAVGNFIDRARFGYVVDFVDMGFPGGWRFYTWNVADAAITISILLLLLMVFLPPGRRETPAG
ncbi:MAG: signal peptidase II [Chloroflexi bacterium]|nr:signal peptidase II [Chloroflexota bacterium]